jgi:hypothetical protein
VVVALAVDPVDVAAVRAAVVVAVARVVAVAVAAVVAAEAVVVRADQAVQAGVATPSVAIVVETRRGAMVAPS